MRSSSALLQFLNAFQVVGGLVRLQEYGWSLGNSTCRTAGLDEPAVADSRAWRSRPRDSRSTQRTAEPIPWVDPFCPHGYRFYHVLLLSQYKKSAINLRLWANLIFTPVGKKSIFSELVQRHLKFRKSQISGNPYYCVHYLELWSGFINPRNIWTALFEKEKYTETWDPEVEM